MLSVEQNERLTRVGPGTPMGELMRRYWHPVAATVELEDNPTKGVRHLGESLVLYKDRSGTYGLIQESCPHRRVNLLYGIPEQTGLRCPYHGWLYDETGRCLEMPAEAPDSTFKDRIRIVAYPVQEMSGLIWAYLGPAPMPLLPRYDLFVWDNVLRDIGTQVLSCNWLQCQENSLDPIHLEWLHAYQSGYILEREGVPAERRRPVQRHEKIGFDLFEHGIIKRRTYRGTREEGGTTEDDPQWRLGHPIIFPNWLRVGNGFQMRIPMDDTHTWIVYYTYYAPPEGVQAPKQDSIPLYDVPVFDEKGRNLRNFTIAQDAMAWITQGPIADRTVEKLAESDKGIILYRRLLQEQMCIVEDGGEPMNGI
ncbi:MAG: Rieske 2Fe-2S domain-containing protein, partial [Chloroflexi bacterium]|nr:Rieske 2Fe-2S domain-containing protein [Chloroflexota bacterium]